MSATPRRIAIFTGTRADYGLLRPVMAAVRDASFDLRVIVGGMHLSPEHGMTVEEIVADGYSIDQRVPCLAVDDTSAANARSIGAGVINMTDALETEDPDLVLVLGDRSEALAAAIATVATNRILAHIHGGDRTRGGLDESYRHAITKLAHVHFTATATSRARVIRMGEPEDRVHCVGAPGLDTIRMFEAPSRAALGVRLGFELPPRFAVVVQHSVSTDPDEAGRQMHETLRAVRATGLVAVVSKPNADPGGRRAARAIDEANEDGTFHVFANLDHDDFLGLLAHAAVLVGNSSSGVIESPSFALPVVDIGDRQAGRECASNVIQVAHDAAAIRAAIERAIGDDFRGQAARAKAENPYGDGHAADRIVDVIRTLSLVPALRQKQITY